MTRHTATVNRLSENKASTLSLKSSPTTATGTMDTAILNT